MHEIPVKIVLCAFENEPNWAHETVFSIGCWPPPGYENDPEGFSKIVADRMFERYNQYPEELFTDFNEKELEDLKAYRDNRNRSLSTGDYVIVGETVLRCASFGWEIVGLDDIQCRRFL